MTQANWKRRQARTDTLGADHPHVAELLTFYREILNLQEPLYRSAGRLRWPEGVRTQGKDGPRLRLAKFTGKGLDRAFTTFIKRVGRVATDLLLTTAERLQAAATSTRADVLQTFLVRGSLDDAAATLDCKTPPLEFFPRAFMQPLTEALTGERPEFCSPSSPGGTDAVRGSPRTTCPRCGWPPFLAVLRGEPDTEGWKLLICSLCSHEWTFPRFRCSSCGETRAEQLEYHVSEFWPHVRIEECRACQIYIKAVDLREDRRAVPVVDELASVELDLWAGEQGLTKLQRNLLGL